MRDTRKIKTGIFNGRSIILAAIGAGTSTRGLNIQNRRPQLIVCDDVQTKENDDSDAERYKLLSWLTGTLFKSRSKTSRTGIIFLGNLYSNQCILWQFAQNKHWKSLITGAILADGSALWEELNPLEALIEEYNHDNELGLGSIWFAEVQNDPIGVGSGLLEHNEIIPRSPATDTFNIDSYPIRWMCIDPAGDKKTSDDNVIAGFCLMEENSIGCFHLDNGKYDPAKVITQALDACLRYTIPIVFIESNAYQGTLAFWMDKALEDPESRFYALKDVLKIVQLPSGNKSKFMRIKAFVKLLVQGHWHLLTNSIYNKVTFQIYNYKLTRQNNIDDIIDSQAMGLKALNERKTDIIMAQYHGTILTNNSLPAVRANNSILDGLKRPTRRH
jgi:hypothetical protein